MRINENFLRSVDTLPRINDRQILIHRPLRVEVPAISFHRHGNGIDLHECGQPLPDRIASGQSAKDGIRVLVLRGEPRACLRTVLIFKPPVRIQDFCSVEDLFYIISTSLWIHGLFAANLSHSRNLRNSRLRTLLETMQVGNLEKQSTAYSRVIHVFTILHWSWMNVWLRCRHEAADAPGDGDSSLLR